MRTVLLAATLVSGALLAGAAYAAGGADPTPPAA